MYSLRKAAMFMFFPIYALVALHGHVTSWRGEHFPVFSWSLFSVVESPTRIMHLEVSRVGEEMFDPPRNYFDLGDHFRPAKRNSTKMPKAASYLARHHLSGTDEAPRLRQGFETEFLHGDERVDYRINVLVIDPIAYHRNGEVIQKIELMDLTKDAR